MEAARLESTAVGSLEQQRGCRVTNGAVAVARLALQLRGRAGRGARLSLVLFVRGEHVGRVDKRDDLVGVDPGHGVQDLSDLVIVVEQQRRVEVGELQRSEHPPLASRPLPAGITARQAREEALRRGFG